MFWYNTLMKIDDIPDFAKPYKKKGYDVRRSGSAYRLVRITSKRVAGKSYPVLVQEYIGTILEDGSLRRKASVVPHSGIYQEFGLSDFLMRRHKRALLRSIYGYSGDAVAVPMVMLAIVHYVFGTMSKNAISHCRLTVGQDFGKLARIQKTRIERLSTKIGKEQSALLGEDKADFELLMRLCVVDSLSETVPEYPEEAIAILQAHGVKL